MTKFFLLGLFGLLSAVMTAQAQVFDNLPITEAEKQWFDTGFVQSCCNLGDAFISDLYLWTGRRAVKHNTAVIEPSVGCAPGGATARRRDGDRTEAARVLGTFSRRRVAATEDVLNAICPAAYARNRHRRSS